MMHPLTLSLVAIGILGNSKKYDYFYSVFPGRCGKLTLRFRSAVALQSPNRSGV